MSVTYAKDSNLSRRSVDSRYRYLSRLHRNTQYTFRSSTPASLQFSLVLLRYVVAAFVFSSVVQWLRCQKQRIPQVLLEARLYAGSGDGICFGGTTSR